MASGSPGSKETLGLWLVGLALRLRHAPRVSRDGDGCLAVGADQDHGVGRSQVTSILSLPQQGWTIGDGNARICNRIRKIRGSSCGAARYGLPDPSEQRGQSAEYLVSSTRRRLVTGGVMGIGALFCTGSMAHPQYRVAGVLPTVLPGWYCRVNRETVDTQIRMER